MEWFVKTFSKISPILLGSITAGMPISISGSSSSQTILKSSIDTAIFLVTDAYFHLINFDHHFIVTYTYFHLRSILTAILYINEQ